MPSCTAFNALLSLEELLEGEEIRCVEAEELTIQSPLSVGQFAGKWCSYNAPPDLPYDQREEDGGSLVFDTDPFTERCEILGSPVLELSFASTAPVAMVAVRLSDVAPDGRATRISYGLLNLTHYKGHSEPERLVPGQRYQVAVQLNGMAPGKRVVECYSWSGDDTSSVRGETQSTVSFARGQWRLQTVTRTVLTSTPTDFQVHAQLDAYEDAQRVHSANWQRVIPRDHV